jgi:hypothetical protein
MKQVFKQILLTGLVLVPFTMHASVSIDANTQRYDQSNYQSTIELHYQTEDAPTLKNSVDPNISHESGPLYSPSDPADPNAPIDTNMYFLLAAALIYGFVLFRKEKRLKL